MPIVTAAKRQKLPLLPKVNRYEATVRLCCKAAGLPMPDPEWGFAEPRKWRFDFAWPSQKIALEVDGAMWIQGRHSRGSGLLKEHEKMNAAARLGWRVFRCTPQNVGDVALYRQMKDGWLP